MSVYLEKENWTVMFEYIKASWPTVIRNTPQDAKMLIGLPYPYLVPTCENTAGFTFNEMFYWDSYFISLGLQYHPQHKDLIVGIAKNMAYMLKRFGMIPNSNRYSHMSHSQPPLFTRIVWLAYEILAQNNESTAKDFLLEMIDLAEMEHNQVWLGISGDHIRLMHEGLSRYYDVHADDSLVVAESGWNQTTRCNHNRWRFHLPVCLNSILYKRELDMAKAFRLLDQADRAVKWEVMAQSRLQSMNKLMWNSRQNFFADYDFQRLRRNPEPSLAMFYPLWARIATQEQANAMVESWLPQFEQKGGLVTTLQNQKNCQWAWPNGFAPLHMIAVDGLEQYGFKDIAHRICTKWLNMCAQTFVDTGKMWDKYNVVEANNNAESGLYGQLAGFAWTWAACDYFYRKLNYLT